MDNRISSGKGHVFVREFFGFSNNQKIMGEYVNTWISNILGFAALIIMTVAAGLLIYLQFAN